MLSKKINKALVPLLVFTSLLTTSVEPLLAEDTKMGADIEQITVVNKTSYDLFVNPDFGKGPTKAFNSGSFNVSFDFEDPYNGYIRYQFGFNGGVPSSDENAGPPQWDVSLEDSDNGGNGESWSYLKNGKSVDTRPPGISNKDLGEKTLYCKISFQYEIKTKSLLITIEKNPNFPLNPS